MFPFQDKLTSKSRVGGKAEVLVLYGTQNFVKQTGLDISITGITHLALEMCLKNQTFSIKMLTMCYTSVCVCL